MYRSRSISTANRLSLKYKFDLLLEVTSNRLAMYIPIFILADTTSDPVNYIYLDTKLLCYLCQYCKCLALILEHPSIVVESE